MLLDQAQRFERVEASHADHVIAAKQAVMGEDERRVVIEGSGIENARIARHEQEVFVRRHRRGIVIDDDFWAPGRSATCHGFPMRCDANWNWIIRKLLGAEIRRKTAKSGKIRRLGTDHQLGLAKLDNRFELGDRQL